MRRAGRPGRANQRKSPLVNKYTSRWVPCKRDLGNDYTSGVESGFVPVGPRRTFEGAVEQIAERIRLGELGEGDRLPSERELAAAMQISRPTVREAVRVLADAGVLSVRPGPSGGTSVASGYVPAELLRSKSELRLGEVAGVLEARRLIEPRVAQLAAVNAREDDFARLQSLIDAAQGDGRARRRAGERGSLPAARHAVPPAHRARHRQHHDRRRSCATCCAASRSRATWHCTSRRSPTGSSTSTSARSARSARPTTSASSA